MRPTVAAVGAIRIEELRICIVRGVSAIEPDDIDPSIRRDRKRAEPMPFGLIHRIIIDPDRRTKTQTAIRASNKHDVSAIVRGRGPDARQHINVIVCARAGTIDREKHLPDKSLRVDGVAHIYKATEIDSGALVECRHHGSILCVRRANAPNLTRVQIYSAQKQIAV